MPDESNPALTRSATPGRSVRLGLSLPPLHRLPICSLQPEVPGRRAQHPFDFGARPMLRSALRVLLATRRIWREPLA
jgi:hypothetical protein